MAVQCPSCGGRMVFDVSAQNLLCTYCGNRMHVQAYEQNNAAQYSSDTYNANLYTCRSCGAELIAPDEQTVAYCAYCGGEAFLYQKNTPLTRPQRIIPFQQTKDQAKQAFENALKGKFYVPKELKQAEFLDTFHGIYLPYWNIEAEVPEREILLEGTKNYTRGRYDYHEDYVISADIGGSVSAIQYDASEAFDDTIANEIAPFERRDERVFAEGYLAGFYSDRPTTRPEQYYEEAAQVAIDSVYKEIELQTPGVNLKLPKAEGQKAQVGPYNMKTSVSLLPVWFLTWRRGDRVAYSVMNGQNGKMAMDLPVNRGQFFLVSLIIAVVVFAALTVASGFITPKIAAAAAGLFLVISSFTLQRELRKIYLKENHVYDYGDTRSSVKKEKRRVGNKSHLNLGGAKNGLIFLFMVIFIAPSVVLSLLGGFMSSGKLIFVVLTVIQAILSIKIVRRTNGVARKTAVIPAILAPLILAAGLMIFRSNPAADYWYYGTAIGCLIGMVVNCLSAVNYFNYLTTRPVPNFFRREGANNAAD